MQYHWVLTAQQESGCDGYGLTLSCVEKCRLPRDILTDQVVEDRLPVDGGLLQEDEPQVDRLAAQGRVSLGDLCPYLWR